MKKIRLTFLSIIIAVAAVATTKATRPTATAFYFIPRNITESASAYKNVANWQFSPVACGGSNNLVCRALSQVSSTTQQLVQEIDNSSASASGEVTYTRSLAQSFKP